MRVLGELVHIGDTACIPGRQLIITFDVLLGRFACPRTVYKQRLDQCVHTVENKAARLSVNVYSHQYVIMRRSSWIVLH